MVARWVISYKACWNIRDRDFLYSTKHTKNTLSLTNIPNPGRVVIVTNPFTDFVAHHDDRPPCPSFTMLVKQKMTFQKPPSTLATLLDRLWRWDCQCFFSHSRYPQCSRPLRSREPLVVYLSQAHRHSRKVDKAMDCLARILTMPNSRSPHSKAMFHFKTK